MLLSIAGGSDLGLFEINEAAALVAEAVHPEANIIFGATIDDALGDEVRVTVIAAGFDGGMPKRAPRGLGAAPRPSRSRPRPRPGAAAARRERRRRPRRPRRRSPPAPPPTPRRRRRRRRQPAPRPMQFDDDDLDVPDFLK